MQTRSMTNKESIKVGRKYAHFKHYGIYYGYPKCCIEYFISNVDKKNKDNIMVANDTGFIPCDNHTELIMKKKLKLNDLIMYRKCKTAFPCSCR